MSEEKKLPPVVYSITDAALAELAEKWGYLVGRQIEDNSDYAVFKCAIAELRTTRTGIDKERKKLTASAREWQANVNSEAKRITKIVEDIEMPLTDTRRAWDEKKERERAEREAAEKARVDGIMDAIAAIKGLPATMTRKCAAEIKVAYDKMIDAPIDPERFEEYTDMALAAVCEATGALKGLLTEAENFEKAQADLKKQEEENARKEKELKEREAELAAKEAATSPAQDALNDVAELAKMKGDEPPFATEVAGSFPTPSVPLEKLNSNLQDFVLKLQGGAIKIDEVGEFTDTQQTFLAVSFWARVDCVHKIRIHGSASDGSLAVRGMGTKALVPLTVESFLMAIITQFCEMLNERDAMIAEEAGVRG